MPVPQELWEMSIVGLSCHAFKLHIQGGLSGPPHKTANCFLTFNLNAQQLITSMVGETRAYKSLDLE